MSTAATSRFSFLVSLTNFDLLVIIMKISATLGSLWLVHGELFISNSYSTFIITQIIDSSVNVIINHLTSLQECLFYIKSGFSWRLQENQAIFLCKSFPFFRAYLSAVVQVSFISNKHDHNIGISILSHLFKPSR